MAKKSYERKDKFYKKAKDEGYVARSAYKIIEFDRKYKIFEPGNSIIDLGCAPGGWLQVAQKRMQNRGLLIGLDLEKIDIPLSENTLFLQGDFLSLESQNWLKEKLPNGADWVISDMAPHLTGIKFKDQAQMTELCVMASEFCRTSLKNQGSFIFKYFTNPDIEALKKNLAKDYERVEIVKSEATRGSSNEFYMICHKKKTP